MSASAQKKTEIFERSEPYLRPHQINEMVSEKHAIEQTLTAPSHIAGAVQNRAQMRRQAQHIDRMLHDNTPTPYTTDEIDRAVEREKELREEFTNGMPTQAEMRRSPAGAIDKHRAWEAKFKRKVFEWKNIRLRLHASGMIDDHADAREVANVEQFRPVHSPSELPMHNVLVSGKEHFLPSGQIAVRNVMSEEDRQAMLERDALVAAAAARAAVDRLMEMQKPAVPEITAPAPKK